MTEPMTQLYLAQIAARTAFATKGPWLVTEHRPDLSRLVQSEDGTLVIDFGYLGNNTQDDAEFVAHIREDVSALLAEIDRLRARNAELAADSDRLAALEAAGVDNWDGYDEAVSNA